MLSAFVVMIATLPSTHEVRAVRGWEVRIDMRLFSTMRSETATAMKLLEAQLAEVERVVPNAAVRKLKGIKLWLSPEYPGEGPAACYHPAEQWLREHQRNPDMAKGIEITNIRIFEAETKRMPNFVLHELAHGYHDRFLDKGFENTEIKAAYAQAVAKKLYEKVERRDGKGGVAFERAYAMTNPMEYFAESTEAYFSKNDFFPFDRAQLKAHDPAIHDLVAKLWGIQ